MSIKSINSEQLKEKLDAGEKILLVDVREQHEWDAGHIEVAQFLPLSEIENRFEELGEKSQTIVLQCRSGKRSMTAAEFLLDKGFSDLTNLEGGIMGWQDEGFDISD